MIHVAYKSRLHSVVRSSMHTCPGNRVAIGRAVECVARDCISTHLMQELKVVTVGHVFIDGGITDMLGVTDHL